MGSREYDPDLGYLAMRLQEGTSLFLPKQAHLSMHFCSFANIIHHVLLKSLDIPLFL